MVREFSSKLPTSSIGMTPNPLPTEVDLYKSSVAKSRAVVN